MTLAEQYVPSGLAALLVATVPIYIALLSWLFGMSKPPSAITWVGLAGGFVGVGVLIGPALRFSKTGESPHAWIGMMILLCSSLIWSVGSLYSRKAKNAPSPLLAAGQQMLCGGALLLIAGTASTGELRHFDARSDHDSVVRRIRLPCIDRRNYRLCLVRVAAALIAIRPRWRLMRMSIRS